MSLISFSSLFAAKKTAQKQNQKQKQVARYESYVDAEPEMEDEVGTHQSRICPLSPCTSMKA